MFQVDRKEVLGRTFSELGDGPWNSPALLDQLYAIVSRGVTVEDIEVEHHFDHIGRKVMQLNARKIVGTDKSTIRILLTVDDATEAANHAREFALQRQLAEGIVDTLREPLLVLDGDLQIIAASRAFYLKFKVDAEQAIGRNLVDLGNGQWANDELIRKR